MTRRQQELEEIVERLWQLTDDHVHMVLVVVRTLHQDE